MLALLFAFAAPAPPPEPRAAEGPALEYLLRVEAPSLHRVDVGLTLEGLAGSVDLSLPQGTTFAQLPEPRLAGDVRVVAPPEAALERTGPYTWRLDPAGAGGVELAWSVPLDHRALPEVRGRDEYEFPYLKPDHGMLTMSTLALAPPSADEERLRVRFDLPSGWEVHAPWPRLADDLFAPPSAGALRDDMLAVGAWDVAREEVSGMELTFAFAPGQERLLDAVVERALPIVAAELELFGSTPQPAYLFLFGAAEQAGYGGSPKTGSMTLFVDPSLPPAFALEGVAHLIAHEFHHTWMRARCRLPDSLRFVGEGFTDYFAHLVPWRLGQHDDASLRATLEEKLAAFERAQAGAARTLLAAGGPDFFAGGSAYEATYAGGLVVALWLDVALRQAQPRGDLAALLRELYEDPRWREDAGPTPADLYALVEGAAGPEVARRLRALVETPGAPDLVSAFAELDVELVRELRPAALELRANLEGTTVLELDPSGLGHRIGLRAGDRLLEVNGLPVADETALRRAWGRPLDGTVHVVLERAGEGEALELRVPRPDDAVYRVPPDLTQRLR